MAVASILAAKPRILIVDEPTTGLDAEESVRMMNMMRTLHRQGHTIIVITHDMGIVANYATRCVLMRGGAIVADGSDPGNFFGLRTRPVRGIGVAGPDPVRPAVGRDVAHGRGSTKGLARAMNLSLYVDAPDVAAPAGRPDKNSLPARALFLEPDVFGPGVPVGALRGRLSLGPLGAESPQPEKDLDSPGVVVCI